MKTPRYECSTTLTAVNGPPLCACGCGESFGPTYKGKRRFKRGHYRFIPDQHVVDPDTGCWIWQGPVGRRGHGLARNDKGINEHAHRLYYEAFVRPLADDEIVHHLCDNPRCCNPEHMEILSRADHQRLHIREQWQRQWANPDEHHIGPRPEQSPSKPGEDTDDAPPMRASSPADPPFAPAPATPVPMRASRRRVGE